MSFQVSDPRRETGKLATFNGNSGGNQVETVSLKALAHKVLHGNHRGNYVETCSAPDGNFKGKKQGESFPEFLGGNPCLTIITCNHCGKHYWHQLGHLAKGGKIAGGPCCFGHAVLEVAAYPTEADALAAYNEPEIEIRNKLENMRG